MESKAGISLLLIITQIALSYIFAIMFTCPAKYSPILTEYALTALPDILPPSEQTMVSLPDTSTGGIENN